MKLSFALSDLRYEVDWQNAHDLSIPLAFHGNQPNAFGVPQARAEAFRGGRFVGDTRQGGSCNFEVIHFIPHCNGTHTECVGHISEARIPLVEVLPLELIPATLITVTPERATETDDDYIPKKDPADLLVTRRALSDALDGVPEDRLVALVIRTLPNGPEKLSRIYQGNEAPYFSTDAMNYVCDRQIEHLLVDLPSVDRADDEGKLAAHHVFWSVMQGTYEVNRGRHSTKTITELIFVPENAEDGTYLLNLQVASFVSDAAPSRPLLYPLREI